MWHRCRGIDVASKWKKAGNRRISNEQGRVQLKQWHRGPQEGPRGQKIEVVSMEGIDVGIDVASMARVTWYRCGIDVASMWHRCGIDKIDVASMWWSMWHRCGSMWQRSGIDVRPSVWHRCGIDVAIDGLTRHRCGIDVDRSVVDVASMWHRCGIGCGIDVVSMWHRCGIDVASMDGQNRCGIDVALMWYRWWIDGK